MDGKVECTCHRSETRIGYSERCPIHGGASKQAASSPDREAAVQAYCVRMGQTCTGVCPECRETVAALRNEGWCSPDEVARRTAAAQQQGGEVAETMRGDVHHHLNVIVGMLRWDVAEDESSDHRRDWIIERLQACTDAADAALGEKPMREQLDELRARLARGEQP